MKKFLSLILIISTTVFWSCKNKEKTTEAGTETAKGFEQVTETDSLLIAYERGVCFGECPQDKINIYKSGYAVYEGKKDVDIVGKANNQISEERMKELKNYIKDSLNIGEYPKKFGMSISDLPTKTITFNTADQRKTIAFKSNDKEELRELVRKLNSTIEKYFMY